MTGVAVGDIDADGDLDIVTVNWLQPHAVFFNDGHGRFPESRKFGAGDEQTWSVVLGDMDLDGTLDVVVGNANASCCSEDTNGDGRPDRMGQESRHVPRRIYVNEGRGALTPWRDIGAGSDDTRPLALGDVDGDGDLDVVMGNDCQPSYVFFNPVRGRTAR
jgi:hypothetical protein